jgi:uncharacterized Zn finger protein (UPF0148 family)
MIVVDGDTLLMSCRGYGAVMLTTPRMCPGCQTMHYWFINRDGRTRCVECDHERKVAA